MKKRKLKKWVKEVLVGIGAVIVVLIMIAALNWLDNSEQKRAYEEGRTEIHYTTTGERYYK